MSPFLILFATLLVVAQFLLPRRWAFLPLLIAAAHTGRAEIVGDLTIARLLILVGLLRVVFTGDAPWHARNPLDLWMALFAGLALLSSVGHHSETSSPFIARVGLVLNVCGTYLYARAYLCHQEAFYDFSKCLVFVLIPLAVLMGFEQHSGRNPYAIMGARKEYAVVREGRTRAEGPFGTPILAGTAGAVSLPLFFGLYRRRPGWAIAGSVACLVITVSAASSGPIMTLFMGAAALALWPWRTRMRRIRWLLFCTLLTLHLVKERPIWYLADRVDLVGGSTGWHRAKLIDEAITHFNEWWLVGTDYTRHWMPYGLRSSQNHCDLTNYYIYLGVTGGLGLVVVVVVVLTKAFQLLGRRMISLRRDGDPSEFGLWCVGAVLFAHAITWLSVSYFDQMYVFFWILIGAVPGFIGSPVTFKLASEAEAYAIPQEGRVAPSVGQTAF